VTLSFAPLWMARRGQELGVGVGGLVPGKQSRECQS